MTQRNLMHLSSWWHGSFGFMVPETSFLPIVLLISSSFYSEQEVLGTTISIGQSLSFLFFFWSFVDLFVRQVTEVIRGREEKVSEM